MDVEAFLDAVRHLAKDADAVVEGLDLPPGHFAVNVHAYALGAYEAFLRRHYDDQRPRAGAIAMNPGRNGAVQTGIPFTDRDLAEQVVPGFASLVGLGDARVPAGRREMSGRRVLGWGIRRFGSAAALYRHVLFYLTCPIAVMVDEPVRNVPLPTLPREPHGRILDLIIRHTPALIHASAPSGVMLLGRYAQRVWRETDVDGVASAVAPHPAARIAPGRLDRAMSRAFDAVRPD